mgnify:CR=1 FL=1
MAEKVHFLKKISGWHYVYIILILVLTLIGLFSYQFCTCESLVSLISFASTISSIILSVLAILITVLSGESMNSLRDSLLNLVSIPGEVKTAIGSTINKMEETTSSLEKATMTNDESITKLSKAIDVKIEEIEKHIIEQLNLQQQNTLKAINENSLRNNDNKKIDVEQMPKDILGNFLESTSNASLALLYIIDEYCKKVKGLNVPEPTVKLKDLSYEINAHKEDDGFSMYLLACLVLLNSFGLIEYEMENEQVYEMKFYAINDGIANGISGQFKKRNLLPPNEGLDQYINSLFNVNNNKEDGTEVSKA